MTKQKKTAKQSNNDNNENKRHLKEASSFGSLPAVRNNLALFLN